MGILSSKLSSKEMALLCRELATTYGAGIPLLKTLYLASQHSGSTKIRHMLTRIGDAIQDGATFDAAVRKEDSLLPDMFIEVIHAGEIGGRLDELLLDLAAYYEGVWKMWRSVLGAMVYPLLQLNAAWFLGTFSLGLVKKFSALPTERFVMREYVSNYFIFQFKAVFVFLLIVAVLIALGRAGLLQMPWAMFKNAVWPIRYISNKFAMARFFRTLALLVGSGLNIRRCIERSAAVTMNPFIEQDLLKAIPIIINGGTLVEAFSGCSYISRVGHEMIAVGEKSGRLDETLKKVAEYYYNDAQAAVNMATKLLVVATVLFVGVIIGMIVISFYSNLYGSLLNKI
ncbi:MAG: type II secretion system F family protein [Candidatus Hydrogenedentes bacterium]|nr:type II secretion system F family protein [Candidatus Hydrogenedentota bacterium]